MGTHTKSFESIQRMKNLGLHGYMTMTELFNHINSHYYGEERTVEKQNAIQHCQGKDKRAIHGYFQLTYGRK